MSCEYSRDEISKLYDGFAKFYDLFESFSEFLYIGRLRKSLLLRAKGHVLELAVGTGANFKYYPPGCKVLGIDISKKMLEYARKKAKRFKGLDTEFKLTSVEDLKFKNGSFDCIVDTLGLCAYQNPVEVLKKVGKFCKKDGLILLLEHGRSNRKFISRSQKDIDQKHYKKHGCTVLRDHESIVREAGLEILEVKRFMLGIIYVIVARPK